MNTYMMLNIFMYNAYQFFIVYTTTALHEYSEKQFSSNNFIKAIVTEMIFHCSLMHEILTLYALALSQYDHSCWWDIYRLLTGK